MDSKAILDYALFQLTPTRTRCELLVFSGAIPEKLASGLFEPFVSHLIFLKNEISKGGYSIKLLPPTNGAFWFSKATFERFVRFVSTPAVLERLVSIEKEILQIESSFATLDGEIMPQTNSNARRLSDSTKVNGALEDVDNKQEENSKISLHRLLESRIALLRKEQAMAYTRGLVAGFEIDNIDDLIYFANAFGALRLREACINFKELWKKKHADDLWIKEVAAMQSCLPPPVSFSGTSGIILANDIIAQDQNNKNNSSDDSVPAGDEQKVFLETTNSATLNKKEDLNVPTSDQMASHTANVHTPMPWPYNVPPYMYNLQNPVHQMPPYQGYPLTNMQSVPPYLLRNMQWPSSPGVNQKPSATKKEKSLYKKGSEEYEDQQTESNDSDTRSEYNSDKQQDSNNSLKDDPKRKKHRRKSSGTVVIRNINYITPKRRNGNDDGVSDESSVDDDDDVMNEETIKQKVGVALESLQKVHKIEKHANGKKAVARHKVTKSSDATEQDLTEKSSNTSEGGNKNENWDAFQNLLKIDEDTGIYGSERMQPIDVQDEHFMGRNFEEERMPHAVSSSSNLESKEVMKNPEVPNDSFIVTRRDGGNEGGFKLDKYIDSSGPVTKSRDYMSEEILLSHRSKEPGNELGDPLATFIADSSVTKGKTAEDWFIVDNLEMTKIPDPPIVPAVFDGDCTLSSVNDNYHTEKRMQRTLIDDSFMIQGQWVDNNPYDSDSQWKTDLSVVADLTSTSKLESNTPASTEKHASLSKNMEPDDLCVVLQRDSVEAPWTVDYEIDFSFSETDRRSSINDSHDNDANKKIPVSPEKTNVNKGKVSATRNSEKEEKSKALRGSYGKSKPEIMSRNKKPTLSSRPIVHKSKREQEDEIRKKMEELRIERERRIAERTASFGLARAVPRKDQIEGKAARVSTKIDKSKTQSMRDTNRISSVKVRGL